MSYEQMNLYGDKESFRAVGKTNEEFEKEAREGILENKVSDFIDKNEKDINKVIKIKGEFGMLDLNDLVRRFAEKLSDDEITVMRTLFAKLLAGKNYKLGGAVVRSEIRDEDGIWCNKETKVKSEKTIVIPASERMTKDEIRDARAKLPPQQRGIPTGDL